jgi:hypothetical protein
MTPYLWASQVYNSFFRDKHEKLPSSGKKHEKLLLAAILEHVP